MKCPECKIALDKREIGNVSVDICSRCNGLWFDNSELDAVKDELEPDLRWMDLKIWPQGSSFTVSSQRHNCLKCTGVKMQQINCQEPDVDVLHCPACGGAWLSAGVLINIIAAIAKEADSLSAPEYIRQSLREASEMLAHPQNLVSEWRDLKSVLRLLSYRIFTENPKLKSLMLGIQKSLPL